MARAVIISAALVATVCGLGACGVDGTGTGFGALLARTLLLLIAVGALAVVTIRLAARVGIGRPISDPSATMAVLDEVAVGPRQAVVAVRAGSRVVLVGRTPSGLNALASLSMSEWERRSFSDVLASNGAAASGGDDEIISGNGGSPGGQLDEVLA